MRFFTLMIGASALFIAGCAAYFSVRGIALTFGAVSAFTIPIIIMASSLEFGKLIAASFLYRHWKTCHPTLKTYLLFAVGLLICITSAGIYGYLSQAFEQTLSQVEGYEKEIVSLQRQQDEYDRMVTAYQSSGQKGSALREIKQAEERVRLEKYIEERRKDVATAETSKGRLAEETDLMVVGERKRREEEKKRLEQIISLRRSDVQALDEEKKSYKKEIEERVATQKEKEARVSERLAQLDAAVKVYQDKGPGGFLKEDGFKKAAELLKTQAVEREGLRSNLSEINGAIEKARNDLDKRYLAIDDRISQVQSEISQANLKITSLTTGGVEQADNIRTAMENLKQARASVDERIVSLESEIAEASRKITALSEVNSVFGPDSSEELEEKKSALLIKKEDAERRILELEGKIRATDIGSFKFVARAFDPEVAQAEATENPILIKEAMDRAVNRVVKWFIMILVIVFDPLAVTLVIAYNASLLRKKDDSESSEVPVGHEENQTAGGFFRLANLPLYLIVIGSVGFFYYHYSGSGSSAGASSAIAKASLMGELSSRRIDDRAFAYVPEKAFGVCAFSGLRMLEEVGLPKIISDDLSARIPFLGDLAWDPQSCGVEANGRAVYFLQFPGGEFKDQRAGDIVFGLAMPISDEGLLKEFILRQLDLKSVSPRWKILENSSPDYLSIQHKTSHVSVGMDDHCLVFLTSWWADKPNPGFLDQEMKEVFLYGQGGNSVHNKVSSNLSGSGYDLALSLFGENFFDGFSKTPSEEQMWNDLRPYLTMDLTLKARAESERVEVDGSYRYREPVLNPDFGLKVAAKLERIREGEDSLALSGVYGEFVEVFLQRLDYGSVVSQLERVDLTKSRGFDGFRSMEFGAREQGESQGLMSMQIDSTKPGGDSLRLVIDLLVFALNPLQANTGE